MKRREIVSRTSKWHDEEFVQRIEGQPLAEGQVLFREVLPSDPDPAWVDELIRLCELAGMFTNGPAIEKIKRHLAKRGEK